MSLRRPVVFLCVLAAAIAAVPARATGPQCDWPRYGHDNSLSFAQSSDCTSLNAANAALMLPKWLFHAPESMSASATVVNGVVYAGSWDGVMHALDAETGAELWSFKVDDDHEIAFGRIVSTAAVEDVFIPGAGKKKVVLFGGGATLYALEAGRTGPHLLAKVDTDPRTPQLRQAQEDDPPEIEIESSPLVGHFTEGDRIFIGNDIHNNDAVGRTGMMAFQLRKNDADAPEPFHFELLFKFDPERSVVLHSLTEGSGTGWGCGDIWSSPALNDHITNHGVLVFGTGNCDHPDQSDAAGEVGREGIFAIDAKTGEQLWKFHPRGVQDVDDDFGASPNLLDGGITVGEGGKDGWYYKLDLLTGREIWRRHAGQSGHVNTGFAVGGFIGTPSVGLSNGKPAIFGAIAIGTPIDKPLDEDGGSLDASLLEDPTRIFSLVALDVETGAILWRSPLVLPSYGATTYANGVVLVADTFTFTLDAFDANTGLPLGVKPLPGPPSAAPVIVGNTIYQAVGTSESDLEFKAFGSELEDFFGATIGQSPLSPLSGVIAFTLPL